MASCPSQPTAAEESAIKAITLYEPWATLIAMGRKNIETRGWRPPGELIGQRIAIHAGMNRGPIVRDAIEEFFPGYKVDRPLPRAKFALHATHPGTGYILMFHLGRILATAKLVDVARVVDRRRNARDEEYVSAYPIHRPSPYTNTPYSLKPDAMGDFGIGRYLWMLGEVERLAEPVPASGAMGLWEWRGAPR